MGRTTPTDIRRANNSPVLDIDAARVRQGWEARVRQNPAYAQLENRFGPGATIVQQGDVMENPVALFVIEGSIHEILTVEHKEKHREEVVNEIRAGGLAFTQALFDGHAERPAYLSLVTTVEGARVARYEKRMLAKTGVSLSEITSEFQRALQFMELTRMSWIREMDLQSDLEEMNRMLADAEWQVKEGENVTYEQFERAERYQKEAIAARNAMRDALEELESECARATQAARGYELIERHFRQVANDHDIPPEAFALTDALMAQLSGTEAQRAESAPDSSGQKSILTEAEVEELVQSISKTPPPFPQGSLPPNIRPVTVPPRPRPKSPPPPAPETPVEHVVLEDGRAVELPEAPADASARDDDAPQLEVTVGDRHTLPYRDDERSPVSETPTALGTQPEDPSDIEPDIVSRPTRMMEFGSEELLRPHRPAIIPQPPSQPPSVPRSRDWKPPPPAFPTVVVRKADIRKL